jgi:hypothetical protein
MYFYWYKQDKVMNKYLLTLALILFMIFVGCDDESAVEAPENNPDGAYLLGLTRDHQLHYEVYDSTHVIPFDEPDYVIYDTGNFDIEITRGQNNQVAISLYSLPHDLLTVDNIGILHSGQIRPAALPPDTVHFYPTPVIMPRQFSSGSTWNIHTPCLSTDTGKVAKTFLYFYYGYYTLRTYIGRESIVLPGGSYDTYRFRSLIFSDESSSDTLIISEEYFAPDIGLVQQILRADRKQRLIILLEDE